MLYAVCFQNVPNSPDRNFDPLSVFSDCRRPWVQNITNKKQQILLKIRNISTVITLVPPPPANNLQTNRDEEI